MTFIGLFYIKQHPQIDESMKCYGLGTKEKCEDTYINFLDNIHYCTWYTDESAPNWGEDGSHCYYSYEKLSNLRVMILAVLLTAILMGFMQWPLDIVFNALLVSPKKSEYFISEEDTYRVAFLNGDYDMRMDLLHNWRNTDNLSSVEANMKHTYSSYRSNPSKSMRDGDVNLPRAARDLTDIIDVMDEVSQFRAKIVDRDQRKAF